MKKIIKTEQPQKQLCEACRRLRMLDVDGLCQACAKVASEAIGK